MTQDLSSPFPPLYAAWMHELFAGPTPEEPRATCLDCAMCGSEDEYLATPLRFFHPATKCCTYLPEMPNYLVGRILADDDPAASKGRESIEARIDAGEDVVPFGLLRPQRFALLYDNLSAGGFGREPSLRCPHYLEQGGGLCGVWKNRNSVCSTWFCKFTRGEVGLRFWNAARALLSEVEVSLAHWLIRELDPGPEAVALAAAEWNARCGPARRGVGALNGVADTQMRRRIWGNWFGREREFYLACARMVSRFSWRDVLAICGPEAQSLARYAQEAYRQAASDEIPSRLKLGEFTVSESPSGRSRVESKSYDREGLDLPQAALRILPFFDGQPVAEALDQIERELRLRITAGLLRRLVDFGILIAVDEAGARERADFLDRRCV